MAPKSLLRSAVLLALAAPSVAFGQSAVAPTAPIPAVPVAAAPMPLTVNADKPGAVINRDIFGQFAEHLGEGIYGGA